MERLARPVAIIAVLGMLMVVLGQCAANAGRSSDSGSSRSSAEGVRSVLGERTEGGVASGTAKPDQPGPTPLPTNVADEGVVVTIAPTATPDEIPSSAAPGRPGAPIVLGVSSAGFNGPELIRPGPQTYDFVNTGDVAVVIGLFPAATSDADLSLTSGDLVGRTDELGVPGAFSWSLELDGGDYRRVVFDSSGSVLASDIMTVFGGP